MIYEYLKFLPWWYFEYQAVLWNWQEVGPMSAIFIFFVYIGSLVWAFPQSSKLYLTYCLRSSQLLTFCFLFDCMVNQTQMYCMVNQTEIYPSFISPLWLFKGGDLRDLNYWGISDPLHTFFCVCNQGTYWIWEREFCNISFFDSSAWLLTLYVVITSYGTYKVTN